MKNRRALLGRLLLIMTLWHAPIPVLHAHGADDEDAAIVGDFDHHMSHYHSGTTLNSHADFGWHWHLIPPSEESQSPSQSQSNNPGNSCYPADSSESITLDDSLAVSLEFTVARLVASTTGAHSPPENTLPGTLSPATQYLKTYLGSVSLGTLLRVARC